MDQPETILIPGVLSFSEYVKRRLTWDKVRQTVSLDADFYEGSDNLLFPPDWLNRAERIASELRGRKRVARAIGIDPAEGGDMTTMAAVDEYGLIELRSKKTPNTAVITGEAIAFGRDHGVPPEMWIFDQGGGGKEHADRLRDQGYKVRTVAFGETATDPQTMWKRLKLRQQKIEDKEERYAYRNRRAEMYDLLRQKLNPVYELGFGLPAEYTELRRQLAPIPLIYDGEGRLMLPPKNKPRNNSTVVTITELIGRSPDDADALVMANWAMENPTAKAIGGAL